jgi:hypothetical protein
MSELVDKSVETFRTDPAGFAFVALGLVIPAYAEHRGTSSSAITKAATIAGAGLLVGGLVHIGNMLEYSDRIQASIGEIGAEDTRYRMRAYCPRQVTKVVLQKTGFSKKFDEMYEATKSRQRYRFLPHI